MSDYITLLGAEDVRSAGHTMTRAAETMSNAASTIDGAMERQRHFLEDWLARFEIAVEKMPRPEVRAGSTDDDYLPSMAKG